MLLHKHHFSFPEVINRTIWERDNTVLPCPHPYERVVTWTRERDGERVDILSVMGDRDIRHVHYPFKHYSSLADKSLHIFRAMTSLSGKYYCNNRFAGEVTVIPSGNIRAAAVVHCKCICSKFP